MLGGYLDNVLRRAARLAVTMWWRAGISVSVGGAAGRWSVQCSSGDSITLPMGSSGTLRPGCCRRPGDKLVRNTRRHLTPAGGHSRAGSLSYHSHPSHRPDLTARLNPLKLSTDKNHWFDPTICWRLCSLHKIPAPDRSPDAASRADAATPIIRPSSALQFLPCTEM